MQDSIFTKIIKGEIPCHKVYEDTKTIAFLDIYPIQPGHVLVVPKIQVDHFDDLSPEDYAALFNTVQKVAKQVKSALSATRACLRVEGFDVPHAHVHVIPCNVANDFYNANRMQQEPDHARLAAMAQKLYIKGGE
ncbi:MAG TPA: HIT family protein [Candidatus Saccharibacteria bacterium]|nr:HIT family protein [Candidatus Saccharibacteria bacterium]MCB9817799.1 HIT family protein [Candidatus Nomurabacteria bacterium]HPR10592.1 HIT family protein [Candidatus Saccharibacteria bacterium]